MNRTPLAVVAAALVACADTAHRSPGPLEPSLASTTGDPGPALGSKLAAANGALSATAAPVRVLMVEYITAAGSGQVGQTVLQRDVGNRQLSANFAPGDQRRVGWSGLFGSSDDVTFAVDETADATPPGGSVSASQATAAILRATRAWDAEACSDLPLTRTADYGLDLGYIAWIVSGGSAGSQAIVGDVQHAGFQDLDLGPAVLAATFTLVFVDGNGQPTDVNRDGKADVAFREIYYAPAVVWQMGTGIDVESVALHEFGHGLGQGHFGSIVIRHDGSAAASPRAVMNAAYFSPMTTLTGSDRAGHCALWSAWPVR